MSPTWPRGYCARPPAEARLLAGRIRQVRNPNLLGDLSPQEAREALRDALPGVADDVITATADALAETAATRGAFDRDRENAKIIADFAAVWAGHAAEILRGALNGAETPRLSCAVAQTDAKRIEDEAGRVSAAHEKAKRTARGPGPDPSTDSKAASRVWRPQTPTRPLGP